MDWFTAHIASGLFHAVWNEIWKWGAGIGLIILFLAAAYLSPFAKQWFVFAAVVVAAALFIYGAGIKDEKVVCADKTKYVYIRTHTPAQVKKFFSQVIPLPHTCGAMEWGCQP